MKKILFLLLIFSSFFCKGLSFKERYDHYNARKQIQLHEFERAQDLLEPLLVENPTDNELNFEYGEILLNQQKYDDALISFDRVREKSIDKNLIEKAQVNAGVCCIKKKNYKQALDRFEKVLEKSPEHEQARKNKEILEQIIQQEEQQQQQNQDKSDQGDSKDKDQSKEQQKGSESDKGNQQEQRDQDGKDPEQDSEKQQRQDNGKEDGTNSERTPTDDQSKDQRGGEADRDQRDQQGKQEPSTDHKDPPSEKDEIADKNQDTDGQEKKPEKNELSEYNQMILDNIDKEDKAGNKMYLQEKVKQEMKGAHGQQNW